MNNSIPPAKSQLAKLIGMVEVWRCTRGLKLRTRVRKDSRSESTDGCWKVKVKVDSPHLKLLASKASTEVRFLHEPVRGTSRLEWMELERGFLPSCHSFDGLVRDRL